MEDGNGAPHSFKPLLSDCPAPHCLPGQVTASATPFTFRTESFDYLAITADPPSLSSSQADFSAPNHPLSTQHIPEPFPNSVPKG